MGVPYIGKRVGTVKTGDIGKGGGTIKSVDISAISRHFPYLRRAFIESS